MQESSDGNKVHAPWRKMGGNGTPNQQEATNMNWWSYCIPLQKKFNL